MADMSVADIAAVTRNNDGFGDGYGMWFWVVILLAFWGNNGWGNRGNVYGQDGLISDEFIKRDIFNTNQNVSNTSCETQRDVLSSSCQTQRDVLENRYANQLGVQSIISSQKDCCCRNKQKHR